MTLQDEVVFLRERSRSPAINHCRPARSIDCGLWRALLSWSNSRSRRLRSPRLHSSSRTAPSGRQRTASAKKRAAEHNTSRRRETPTRIERHALDRCPVCAYPLSGESIDYTREVIEIPPPPPVEITEHRVIKRLCSHCAAWRSPQLDLSQQVFGQGRVWPAHCQPGRPFAHGLAL